MVTLIALRTLEELRQEMAAQGRAAEESALQEALRALARSDEGLLTTGRAAERLGVSIPTVKRWVERGALAGGAMGGRWLVSAESVERLLRLRQSLLDLDREGNPTAEEIRALYSRPGQPARDHGVTPAPS